MLSGCPIRFAASSLVRAHDAAVPMASSGPTGFTPAQIRHAYGFDAVSFSGATADGAGTTLAFVDAYDIPNIANDLRQFELQFGLPDPVLRKVNQNGGSPTSAGPLRSPSVSNGHMPSPLARASSSSRQTAPRWPG